MFDREIRFGIGSAVMLLWWVTTFGLIAGSWRWSSVELGFAGAASSAMAAALMVIQDNAKTRRVVRALVRETPVRSVRGE